MKNKPLVAFICTHNSCRSQMAEAIAKLKYSSVFDCCSAGTQIKDSINSDAIRIIKKRYGIDMKINGQHNKLLTEIPAPDIVITMGCGVACPAMKSEWKEDWGLADPTGKEDEAFYAIIDTIEEKMRILGEKIEKK